MTESYCYHFDLREEKETLLSYDRNQRAESKMKSNSNVHDIITTACEKRRENVMSVNKRLQQK